MDSESSKRSFDYALKDYALRNPDGTYIRRYFEPGFRAEDLTDEERELTNE